MKDTQSSRGLRSHRVTACLGGCSRFQSRARACHQCDLLRPEARVATCPLMASTHPLLSHPRSGESVSFCRRFAGRGHCFLREQTGEPCFMRSLWSSHLRNRSPFSLAKCLKRQGARVSTVTMLRRCVSQPSSADVKPSPPRGPTSRGRQTT